MDKADMSEILTVDMIKGLLTAQNFSMPAGYIDDENDDRACHQYFASLAR